jgi:hypothetical protein
VNNIAEHLSVALEPSLEVFWADRLERPALFVDRSLGLIGFLESDDRVHSWAQVDLAPKNGVQARSGEQLAPNPWANAVL